MKTKLRIMAAVIGLLGSIGTAHAGAIISNGMIEVGVNDLGHLNAPDPTDTLPNGAGWGGAPIGYVGLRYLPTGAASTEPGCLCEGWGVGIRSTGSSGYANEASGTANLSLVSFSSTSNTAVSVVNLTNTGLQVKHDYHPTSKTSNLYEVTVSITNTSGADISAGDLVYRRVMDWDIYPTPFSEFVTIQGVPTTGLGIANGTNVAQTDNNGFNSSDPFSFYSYGQHNVNFTDAGPDDHGAMFDFEFDKLVAGATLTFNTYYGAAANETEADAARAAVGMGLYSYGQCNPDAGFYAVSDPSACNPSTGTPNTFIFGFGTTSIGSGVLTPDDPNDDIPGVTAVPEPETYAMLMAGLGMLGVVARRRKQKIA